MRAFLCLALVGALRADTQLKVNPVEKVVTLLEKLQGEIEAEGKAEAVAYDKYACFCKDQVDDKLYAIERAIEQENELKAKIESKTAKKAALDQEISEHNEEIRGLEEDQAAAQEARDTDHAAYVERNEKIERAIDAMTRAIEILQASKDSMKPGLLSKYESVIRAALELEGGMRNSKEGRVLLRFLQGGSQQAPAAYSYHSNEIIETLKSLRKNFKSKNNQIDEEERATRQEYEMTSDARRLNIEALQKAIREKAEQSSSLEEQIAEHQTELEETETDHAADQSFMDDLTAKCEQKAKDFDQRSSTRTQELTAISKALELLKGDVSKMYSANKLGLIIQNKNTKPALPAGGMAPGHWVWVSDNSQGAANDVNPASVAQANTSAQASDTETTMDTDDDDADDDDDDDDADDDEPSFLQVDRKRNRDARAKLVKFLSGKASSLKSAALNTLLLKVRQAASASPFAKVKQMIQDLISRLKEEAEAEASQKEFCDTEMAAATANRDEAQNKIESLNAKKTQNEALVEQLKGEIQELSAQIAELTKALNEETILRDEEKADNKQTLLDASAGLVAVNDAINLLNEFYNPGAAPQEVTTPAPLELVQDEPGYQRWTAENADSSGKTVEDLAPTGEGDFSGEYGGKTKESASIIGLLEVIKSDYENTLQKTQDEEGAADAAFQTFKSDTETDIQDKTDLKQTKETEQSNTEMDIVQNDADLKTESEALKLAVEELEKLKPLCVETGVSHEERTARREEEIAALKEALEIFRNAFSF